MNRRIETASSSSSGAIASDEARAGAVAVLDPLSSLLSVKMAPPRVPPTMVHRSRLDSLLAQGTDRPVTLVSAGPGTGKTLSVASWAGGTRTPGAVAWLTLDETDNEVATFWFEVLAALKSCGGIPPDSVLHDLRPAARFGAHVIQRIQAGLADLPAPVVLVLDDLQEVADATVLGSVDRLLEHPPAPLRLVLVARVDPALRLHRLRVSGELSEVRTGDLAFDPYEADELFANHGLRLSRPQRDTLMARTEGWAAGLRLAAMSLDPDDVDRGIAGFSGEERSIAEYLAAEVLDRQPTSVRHFLLRTSVADRLCGPLADALSGRVDGRRLLEQLAADNALVVGVGPRREWFHYHPLLRELLLHQVRIDDPTRVPELHRRAAAWFAERGESVDAIRHAVAAEDWELVGRTLLTVALPRILSGQGAALAAVLQPAAARATFAPAWESLICAATYHFHGHDYAAMDGDIVEALAVLDTVPSNTRPAAEVVLTLFEIASARTRGDIDELIRCAKRALHLLEATPLRGLPAARHYRVVARGNLGVGYLWRGRLTEAESCFLSVAAHAEQLDLELPLLNALAHLAVIDVARGRLRTAHKRASTVMIAAERRGWESEPQIINAYLALALTNLQWASLGDAAGPLERGLAASTGPTDRAAHLALRVAQVRLLVSRGDAQAALEAATELRDHAVGSGSAPEFLERWISVAEAEALLLAGDARGVLDRMGEARNGDRPADQERVCLARAMLALGQGNEAARLLGPLVDHTPGDLGPAVDAWLVTALVADHGRLDSAALDAVTRALSLAEPERLRRPFQVLDHRVRQLVLRHQELVGSHAEFAAEILDGLTPSDDVADVPVPLAAPLTDRELTMLRYLPTMLTNSEIGADLSVSVNTVKAHLKSLYRKLDVADRRGAVRRARTLGLI